MILLVLVIAFLSFSCVQMPTERASVVDSRPQISFKAMGDTSSMVVFIDGLDMGKVSNYLDDGADGQDYALRILPGSHLLRVEKNGKLIHEEKLYVGDGVAKVIQLP